MKRNRGSTLTEKMITLAVIVILAVIAIPKLLDARKAANASNAISSLQAIAAACQKYHKSNDTYPPHLTVLLNANLIDPELATGTKAGYHFGAWNGGGNGDLAGTDTDWICYAEPEKFGLSGDLYFVISADSGIQVSLDGTVWKPLVNPSL